MKQHVAVWLVTSIVTSVDPATLDMTHKDGQMFAGEPQDFSCTAVPADGIHWYFNGNEITDTWFSDNGNTNGKITQQDSVSTLSLIVGLDLNKGELSCCTHNPANDTCGLTKTLVLNIEHIADGKDCSTDDPCGSTQECVNSTCECPASRGYQWIQTFGYCVFKCTDRQCWDVPSENCRDKGHCQTTSGATDPPTTSTSESRTRITAEDDESTRAGQTTARNDATTPEATTPDDSGATGQSADVHLTLSLVVLGCLLHSILL